MNKKLWIFSSFLLSIFVLAACGSANLDLVEEQTLNLNVGDTYTLTVEEEASLTYETEDSSVATVNSSGVVTAVSEGVTTIIASDGEETDAVLVNVYLSFEENPVVDLEYSSADEIIVVYEDGTRVNTGLVASNQDGSDGSDGEDGEDGVSIASALVSGGALFVTLTDGTVLEAGDVEGARGPAGPAGPQGPTGATGAQGVSVESVRIENRAIDTRESFLGSSFIGITNYDEDDLEIVDGNYYLWDAIDNGYDFAFSSSGDISLDYASTSNDNDLLSITTLGDDLPDGIFADSVFILLDHEDGQIDNLPDVELEASCECFQNLTYDSSNWQYVMHDAFEGFSYSYIMFIPLSDLFDGVSYLGDIDELTINLVASGTEDYLVFGLDDGSEIDINFSEFLAGSAEFQNLEVNQFLTIWNESRQLANQIQTNSIYGFDPFAWNELENNISNLNNLHSSVDYTSDYVSSSTMYDRGADFLTTDRLGYGLEYLTAALTYARYYELANESNDGLGMSNGINDLIEIYLDETFGNSFNSQDYLVLHQIISALMGVDLIDGSELAGLDFVKALNDQLSSMNQNLFFQYVMTNPLTGWDVNSVNDLRAFISMLAREDLFSVEVSIDYDPEGFGIKPLNTDNSVATGGRTGNYFSTDWMAGGTWGLHSDTVLSNYFSLNIDSGDYDLDILDNYTQLDYYFGTPNIHPSTYSSGVTPPTNGITFVVNYGQTFPIPTEVNFRGMVIGATNEQLGGADGSGSDYQVSTTLEDEGALALDYIVYGDNDGGGTPRTFRLVTYWFDRGYNNPNNSNGADIPDCQPYQYTARCDDPIGIFHANQDYFDLDGIHNGVSNVSLTSIVTESYINIADTSLPRDSFNEQTTMNATITTQVAFYSYRWPDQREYITYDRLYDDELYNTATPQNIAINAYWQEVFQVEWLVSGTSVRYEIVDDGSDAIAVYQELLNSQAVLDAIPDGYELDPGNEWDDVWTNITSNKTINANLREIVYNIGYLNLDPSASQSAASTPSLVTYSASSLPLSLQNPGSISGYSFVGWRNASGSAVTQIAIGTFGNVTYTAIWNADPLNINFNANGGSGSGTQGTVSDQNVTLTAFSSLNISRAGYTFTGWNTAANGSGTNYTNAYVNFPVEITAITLYAQWQADPLTITFDANGGSGSGTQETVSDQNVTLTAFSSLNISRAGYTFAGWDTNPDGTGADYNDAEVNFPVGTSDITLYAQWTADTQTINFDAAGGTGSGSQNGNTDANVSLTALSALGITRSGFTFSGWATVSGGSMVYNDEDSFTVPASNTTLYAVWAPITYSVATSIDAPGVQYTISVTGDREVGQTITVTISGNNINITNIEVNNVAVIPGNISESSAGSTDTWTITFEMPADDVIFSADISED